MACGCGMSMDDRTATALVMCVVCEHRKGSVTVCTIDGKPMMSRPCPIERHPDEDGLVEWAGDQWAGVPSPLRRAGCLGSWRRRLGSIASGIDWAGLPGCGRVA